MTAAAAERAQAARLLKRIVAHGETADQAFGQVEISPLVRELVFGSLRHWYSLSRLVDDCLHRSLQHRDRDLQFLLIVGAYQLQHTRIPDHAAIFETVAACRPLRKPRAAGLVNAVLRACVRRLESAADLSPGAPEPSFDHPPWLQSALQQDYPDAAALMRANNQRAPLTLRINRLRIDPDAYLARLAAAGIEVLPAPATPPGCIGFAAETRTLAHPLAASELPGYAEGLVSIQDAGAQFAAPLLAPQPGDRVVDACAAPGGKLFHLRERYPDARYLGLDRSPRRVEQMARDADRLGHSAITLMCADAATLDWWDGEPFQRVLLDAPCSGTGTLRRHPDIKLLRTPDEVTAAAALQARLLDNLWHVLAPGGTLVYCTCSLLTAENDAVITAFAARHDDTSVEAIRLASGRAMQHGWQLLPTDPLTDGFYYARLHKAGR
jgi:16S rRNA (cytosine967-C5)-methyltransferase